jgi:hypothetical protein
MVRRINVKFVEELVLRWTIIYYIYTGGLTSTSFIRGPMGGLDLS